MDAKESYTLGVLPSGTVGLVATAPTPSDGKTENAKCVVAEHSLSPELVKAFSESAAAGLTLLASSQVQTGLSPTEEFWRIFGRRYFRSLCRQSPQNARGWSSPRPPGDDELNADLQSAPPMVGLEYLSNDSLTRLWKELDEYIREQVAALTADHQAKNGKSDIAAYLRELDPDWNLVGRVTFHLAENKKNEAKPFAFLATYTDDRVTSSSPQHIPLADALNNRSSRVTPPGWIIYSSPFHARRGRVHS